MTPGCYCSYVKANQGMIFAYNYRAWLANDTSWLSTIHTRTIFTNAIHNVSYECPGSNSHDMIYCEVMTHGSRAW